MEESESKRRVRSKSPVSWAHDTHVSSGGAAKGTKQSSEESLSSTQRGILWHQEWARLRVITERCTHLRQMRRNPFRNRRARQPPTQALAFSTLQGCHTDGSPDLCGEA